MIRVLVEVGKGAARFSVIVRAGSIEEAMDIVRCHYPDDEPRIVHPIDPESYFVRDPAASVLVEQPRARAE
jgi:hypothetical protein